MRATCVRYSRSNARPSPEAASATSAVSASRPVWSRSLRSVATPGVVSSMCLIRYGLGVKGCSGSGRLRAVTTSLSALAGLGLVLGLRHAFEPDHLAAVSTLATRQGRLLDAPRPGPRAGAAPRLGAPPLGGPSPPAPRPGAAARRLPAGPRLGPRAHRERRGGGGRHHPVRADPARTLRPGGRFSRGPAADRSRGVGVVALCARALASPPARPRPGRRAPPPSPQSCSRRRAPAHAPPRRRRALPRVRPVAWARRQRRAPAVARRRRAHAWGPARLFPRLRRRHDDRDAVRVVLARRDGAARGRPRRALGHAPPPWFSSRERNGWSGARGTSGRRLLSRLS